jgi:hypothetical protein
MKEFHSVIIPASVSSLYCHRIRSGTMSGKVMFQIRLLVCPGFFRIQDKVSAFIYISILFVLSVTNAAAVVIFSIISTTHEP